jgi:hypothetical protein
MHAVNNSLAVIFDSALVEDRVSLLLGVAATIGEPEDRILQSTHFFFCWLHDCSRIESLLNLSPISV